MIVQLVGAITNIILDPIFIFGYLGVPAMGVAGAALATVAGQIVACIVGYFINQAKNTEIKLSLKTFRPEKAIISNIYSVGIPSIIMGSIGSIMTGGLNLIFNGFGAMTTAAQNVLGIYFKVQSFVFMPVFGLNNGLIPIVAYNYGAQKRKRIVRVVGISSIFAVSFMMIGLACMQLFPEQLLGIFNISAGTPEMEIGVRALRTISLSFIFAGFSISIAAVFQAFGQSVFSMFVSIARQLVVLLPAAYLLAQTSDGLHAIWWAFPIAELMSITASVIFLIIMWNKTIKHHSPSLG